MRNEDVMTLKLKRINVCDLSMAITHLIFDMRDELLSDITTETRKEILSGSIKKWELLKCEVNSQRDEQDKLEKFI